MFRTVQGALLLGPRFFPKVATTFTNLRLYCMRRFARPVFFFFFSAGSTWSGHKWELQHTTHDSLNPHIMVSITHILAWLVVDCNTKWNFFQTFGVCPLTFPARAKEPWTLPREKAHTEHEYYNTPLSFSVFVFNLPPTTRTFTFNVASSGTLSASKHPSSSGIPP